MIVLRSMRRKNVIATVLVLLAMLASAALRLYYIRNDSGGTLIWNDEEAYLLMSTAQRGLRVRYVSYPLVLLKEFFYGVTPPDDEHVIVTVVHVTASSTERHVINIVDPSPGSPGLYTPLRGHIYADCPELGGLCRWNSDHFERATDEEQRQLDGINKLTVPNFVNVGGWSRRDAGAGPGQQFTVGVGNSFSILVKNEAKDPREYQRISVQVLRFGRVPETVWYLDETPHRVSRSSYGAAFNTR